jgi:hypothetical protein
VVSARQHDSAAAWALALAARLRVIHAGFVDEPPDQRRAFVADEIERAVQSVAPSQKGEYLNALAEEFPAWESVEPAGDDSGEPVPAGELVAQLLARIGELSAADRERLAAEFVPAGGPPAGGGGDHLELWKRFGLPAETPPSGERTWKLLGSLIDFFGTLDQLGWTLWRNMGVKSAFWKESEFNKLAGPYLAGDHEVSSEQLRQTVERTRRLIAAIVGAPGRAANQVANQLAEQFSPDSIEMAARAEKRALESLDAACWRVFKQRYSGQGTAPHVEAAVQTAVARAAEDLIGGRTR